MQTKLFYLKRISKRTDSWSETREEALSIIEQNRLDLLDLKKIQEGTKNWSKTELILISQLIKEELRLIEYLKREKTMVLHKISRMDHKDQLLSGYIAKRKAAVFVDRDF